MKIVNRKFNLSNRLNKKIVLISDIHYSSKADIKKLNKLVDNIKLINPDYICISGDLIDIAYVKDDDYLINFLTKLGLITKTIISIGNHEFYIDKKRNIYGLNKNLLNKISNIYNIYLLDNKCILLDNINFIGITLEIEGYTNSNYMNIDLNRYINKKYYNILLFHSPLNIELLLKNYNIDLVLCGHMHGGVTPNILKKILKGRGIISPVRKLFPKYAYGLKKYNNTSIITTSGITILSNINKFRSFNKFFKSEIVIINI